MSHVERPQKPEQALLSVENIVVEYASKRLGESFQAVRGVSFDVHSGETVGLVGESGSGKSSIGRAILGLTKLSSGRIIFDGEDISHTSATRRRELSRSLQVIFQDPFSSLNPTRRVGQTLAESLGPVGRRIPPAVTEQVSTMLAKVGMEPEAAERFPSEFSGGQRQRIAIARALMVRPRLVVCDEPVSALDLSVQAQVLNLFADLQEEFQLSFLFIAHDLAVVRHLCDRVVVLQSGAVVEQGDAHEVYDRPKHPYTQALIAAVPVPDPRARQQLVVGPG